MRKFLGYFVWKITVLHKKNHIFSKFRGERAGCAPPPPWIHPWFRSCGLQNHPPTPSARSSMKNLKTIVDNYQCISNTLYSLTSINCVVTVRGVALRIAEILQTDGRTDIKCLSNGRKNLITLKDQTKFSRNMFTEIRCEICINHSVEIIFTLSCAVVDINLLQINFSQNLLLKIIMCKKNCTDIHW